MSARRRWSWALLLLPLFGCAYFNGMYNARRLAGGARKAEREGRTFEANRLWGLASTKAESLQVQHPRSKYVPEARLIQATALARSGSCDAAVPLADRALTGSREVRVTEEAALLLALCSEQQGDPASALENYSRLVGSKDPKRRAEAVYGRARAERMLGLYPDALGDLAQSTLPRARGERATVLMALGKTTEALPIVDSLIAAHDSTVPWNDLIEFYGRSDPAAASALVDRLAHDSTFRAASRLEWVVADAERLSARDPAGASARLALADSMGAGASERSRRVQYSMVRAELAQVGQLAELRPFVVRFNDLGELGGAPAPLAYRTARSIQAVLASADSSQREAPQFDLRLFYAAEMARDSLSAPTLAATLFQQLVTQSPQSPYAPKAALASMLLSTGPGDSNMSAALARYQQSPYLLAQRGEEAPGYRELEDSLRLFMRGYRPAGDDRRQRPGTRPVARPSTREPDASTP